MNTITASTLKELSTQKEEHIKPSEIHEIKEIPDIHKNIIQEADTDTAKSYSLSSLIEMNRNDWEYSMQNLAEEWEYKEGYAELSEKDREKVYELTEWSDDILDSIGSIEEAEIYIDADLEETEINGKSCLVFEDIDPDQEDEDGISNRERMQRGRPPLNKNGEEIELHHIGQKQSSPLAELTMEQHRGTGNDTILHNKTKETEIDRNEFGKERRDHWKNRIEEMEA